MISTTFFDFLGTLELLSQGAAAYVVGQKTAQRHGKFFLKFNTNEGEMVLVKSFMIVNYLPSQQQLLHFQIQLKARLQKN
jgi:hypothetical protein